MIRFRSILALVLAVITTFLVSCGGPTPTAQAPTYSTAQIEQIQRYSEDLEILRERLLSIPPLVQSSQWNDVKTLIHGPLGELRFKMLNLARLLDPKSQEEASAVSKEVFGHLVNIDEATQTEDSAKALRNYNEVLKDFDAFLDLIPDVTKPENLALL